MVGHVSASFGLDHFDANRGQRFGQSENVLFFRATPEGEHSGMFQQQQRVADGTAGACVDERALKRECTAVFRLPEPHGLKATSGDRSVRITVHGQSSRGSNTAV